MSLSLSLSFQGASIPIGPNGNLQRAIIQNSIPRAEEAIEAGANVNEPSPTPPLSLAAWHGERGMLQTLCTAKKEYGGKPILDMQMTDQKYGKGGNALHIASSRNNHEILHFLANVMRVDLYLKDDNGKSPLQVLGTTASGKRKNATQKKTTFDWFVKEGVVERESGQQSE